jgi:hypothetical protein
VAEVRQRPSETAWNCRYSAGDASHPKEGWIKQMWLVKR